MCITFCRADKVRVIFQGNNTFSIMDQQAIHFSYNDFKCIYQKYDLIKSAWNMHERQVKTDMKRKAAFVHSSKVELMEIQLYIYIHLWNFKYIAVTTQSTSLFSVLWYTLTSFIHRYLSCHLRCAHTIYNIFVFWAMWNKVFT